MRIPGGAKMLRQAGQAAVASSLVALMVVAPVLADAQEPMAKASIPSTARTAPLSSQEKTLHALNRLTFGPRPGDEAEVAKEGLEAWFQQQLHPDTIDDSALNTRLNQFPAMKLSSVELMRRFPAPNIIKQAALRGAPLPSDPTLHAIYADEVAMYDLQQSRAAAGQPPVAGFGQQGQQQKPAQADPAMKADGDAMMDGGQMMADGKAAPATDTGKAKGKKNIKNMAEPMAAADVQAVLALPGDERMKRVLGMSPDEFISFRVGLKPYQMPMLLRGLTPEQTEILVGLQGGTRVVATEALETRLLRDVYSDRQLQAVMTDFWLNHFSVYVRKNQNESYYLPEYERQVILPNALGKFENLLVATAKSSAMLMYLDNWESIGPDSASAKRTEQAKKFNPNGPQAKRAANGLNENYARELMELHTLGVNGGYTQKDVQEVAKVFTGWTIDRPYQAMAGMGEGGGGIFDESRHEPGAKTVLGKTIPEGGSAEGMQVLHMLATSPATAKFICTKLAVRFVSDNPPDSLVKKMSDTFLTSGGDIRAVLTTMFHAPEFWSPDVYRAKVKTPIEFMASALRAANADVKNPQPLVQAMDRLGMPIYGMQTPNGYSWKEDEWVSSNALISRMNFALVLSSDRVPGTQTDWTQMLGQGTDVNDPSAATEKQLEGLVLGEPATDRTRATVLTQFKDPNTQTKAAEDFANAKPKSGEMDTTADGSGMDAAAARATYRPGRNGGRDFAQLNNKPQTPLDTMAGLLLGSPDFQRR